MLDSHIREVATRGIRGNGQKRKVITTNFVHNSRRDKIGVDPDKKEEKNNSVANFLSFSTKMFLFTVACH